jgi:PKD repeat protein
MKNFNYVLIFLLFFSLITSWNANAQNVSYKASVDSGCAPLVVNFTNTSLQGGSFEWDFGDGSPIDTTNNAIHTFYATGEFWVTLTAYDNVGSFIESYQEKFIVKGSSDNFYASADTVCPNESIYFFSGDQASSYYWDFDDGVTDNQSSISHYFTGVGTFNVKLIINTVCGIDTIIKPILIDNSATPNVDFYLNTNTACPGDVIQFNQFASSNYTYLWNFGDGDTSSFSSPEHIYNTVGSYMASLTATNVCGNSITKSETVFIDENFIPDAPYFYLSQTEACVNNDIYFTSFTDATSYLWNFGDGDTSTVSNPIHYYKANGTYPISLTVFNNCGNSNTYTDTVFIGNAVMDSISFYSSVNEACIGDSIGFESFSTMDGITYLWHFGDGDSSSYASPYHAYKSNGTYTISLTATNNCGNSTTTTNTIDIGNAIPDEPLIILNQTEACPNEEINFYLWSNESSFIWNFGDSNTSTASTPNHSYALVGTYAVSATVTNACGNSNIAVDTIVIDNNIVPAAPLLYLPKTEACIGENISFSSYTNATSYLWNFGDGTTDTASYSSHIYKANGNYLVSLTVTNMCGNSNTSSDTIFINNTAIPEAPGIYLSKNEACLGEVIDIDSWTTADSYLWDFGDGNTSTSKYNSHVYNANGIYIVSLTITNSCGNSNTSSDTIVVGNNNYIPTAPNLILSNTEACVNDDINFSTSSTSTSYLWDFGDGTTSSDSYTTHKYTANGTYTVSLTISNSCGNTNTTIDTITIGNTVVPESPIINLSKTEVCIGDEIDFSSWTNATSILWNFGDGDSSISTYATHSYKALGTYFISLTISNSCGNSTTSLDTIFVGNNIFPATPSIFSRDSVCPGDEISFYTDNALTYQWNFGDGNSSFEQFPDHSYSSIGTYTTTLTISNGCANTSSVAQTVYVGSTIFPDNPYMYLSKNEACQGEPINFSVYSNNTSYLWDFGDGDTSNQATAVHQYTSNGNYYVTLTVSNSCGNTAKSIDSISIGNSVIPDAEFVAASETMCPGDEFIFMPDNFGAQYLWDFGDGSTSNTINLFDGTNYINHSYVSSGSYKVMLTITNACGNSDTDSIFVNVSQTANSNDMGFEIASPKYGVDYRTCENIAFLGYGGSNIQWNFGDSTTNSSSAPLHSYNNPGTYRITVSISNGCGGSKIFSDSIVVTGACVIGIPEEKYSNSSIKVYPNPTDGKFTFEIEDIYTDEVGEVKIINVLGETIYLSKVKNFKSEIDLRNLQSGMYFLQVLYGKQVYNKQIVIN